MTLNVLKTLSQTLCMAAVLSSLSLPQDAAGAAGPSDSATLRILVSRQNGTAISGAAVCVAPVTGSGRSTLTDIGGQGTFTGSERSALTDLGGQATFNDIAQGQVKITVSRSGFTGQSRTSTLPAGGGTARFILSEGSGGPVCTVAPTPPPRTPPTLAITSFDWHVNRRTPLFFEIALAFGASETPGGPVVPTHYRVGESSDLSGAQWISYQGGVPLFQLRYRGNSLTAYGQRTLFLQLKLGDLASAAASKSVDLEPVQSGEFRLSGSTLSELLDLIRANGFHLGSRTVSATQNHCSAIRLENLSFDIPNGYLPDRVWEKISEVSLAESSTKRFTPGWRVKSIEIGEPRELDRSVARTVSGQNDGNGFRVTIHLSVGPRNLGFDNTCFQNFFPLKAIVLEGPGDDLALDQTKRWKNMFPPN